jgi:hypothetical protein
MVGSLNVTGTTTSTAFVGDGSGLTGIASDPFPYSQEMLRLQEV